MTINVLLILFSSMRLTMRRWVIHRRTDKSLHDPARMFNPILRSWISYYGRFQRSALYRVLDPRRPARSSMTTVAPECCNASEIAADSPGPSPH